MSNELAIKQETTHWITSVNSNPNPAELNLVISERENALTVKEVFNYPLITNLELPKKEILASIRLLILHTAKQFRWSEKMDILQATTLAIDVYEALKTETLEDITLMFSLARKGKLKDRGRGNPIQLNGRLDNETIFNQIVPAYLDLKAEQREVNYQNKKAIKPPKTEPLTPEQKKEFAKIKKSVTKIGTPKETKKPTPTTLDNMYQEWTAEYDKLKLEGKLPKRIVTLDDYWKLKLKEIEVKDNTITHAQMQKWANEFWELREQNKLPEGIKTYTQFFEWKTF